MGQLAMTYKNVPILKWDERVFMCVFGPMVCTVCGNKKLQSGCLFRTPRESCPSLGSEYWGHSWNCAMIFWKKHYKQKDFLPSQSTSAIDICMQGVIPHCLVRSKWFLAIGCPAVVNCLLEVYVASICVHVNPQQVSFFFPHPPPNCLWEPILLRCPKSVSSSTDLAIKSL